MPPSRATSSAIVTTEPGSFRRNLRLSCFLYCVAAYATLAVAPTIHAQDQPFVVDRDGRSIVVEPYGPNIVRITLSTEKAKALMPAGYGMTGKPDAAGWTKGSQAGEAELFRSGGLQVKISLDQDSHHMPLDKMNNDFREIYFGGDGKRHGHFSDTISVTGADGKPLVTLHNWSMQANEPDSAEPHPAGVAPDPGSHVAATFDSPPGEHYYGLGQQQQGALDLRDHRINCWHDYNSIGGENVCVPFLISTGGYGLIWDNPSKTTIDLGFNQQNVWRSEVGDRVSFFVIGGSTSDQIYEGYRKLTGTTQILPRATYGYIQSKAIYPTQDQLLDVAKGYRERNLPLDVMVVDFLNMTRQGEMDLDPARWPDPAKMNEQLHAMGVHSLLSVWPHFAPGTQFYDMLLKKGWLIHDASASRTRSATRAMLSVQTLIQRTQRRRAGGGSLFVIAT